MVVTVETMIIKIAIMTRLISYAMTSFHIEINLFIPVYEWMLKNERGIKLDTVDRVRPAVEDAAVVLTPGGSHSWFF